MKEETPAQQDEAPKTLYGIAFKNAVLIVLANDRESAARIVFHSCEPEDLTVGSPAAFLRDLIELPSSGVEGVVAVFEDVEEE